MISIVSGPPGNGKSLLEQTVTSEELLFTERDIVTSTPVRILPWVTGDGRPMMGLQAYLRLFCKAELPDPVIIQPGIVAAGRLLVVEDENELGSLFMWRRDRVTGQWYKVRWDSETEQFNREDLSRMGNGQFIITDEAWKCYSSRRWKDAEKQTEFYGRQHRKFGDDWHLVSHSHKDLDVQINRMAQQWQICTNYGLRRLSIFRQPPVFEVKTFYEPPNSHTARVMHTAIRRLDVRLCQTYDTSAGVAVGGGRAADVKRRRKGISMVWLIVAILVLLICLAVVPKLMGVMFQGWFKKSIGIKEGRPTNAVPSQVLPAVRPQSSVAPVKTVPVAQSITAVSNPPLLKVTGHFFNGTKLTVLLSDGTTRTMRRNYRRNEDGTVILDGTEYQVATVEPGPPLPPLQTKTFAITMPGTIREKSSENPVSVTVIGQRNAPMQTATPAASAHLRE